ncbi:MAG: extracellular solute-binding protein, partial [Chloroflexota bacterium]|nr:extracellular solute-binding protein [Chloroflexota bacterium]
MKKLLLLIAIIAALAMVAACAPAPTPVPTAAPPTAAPKPVKLTIWHQWDLKYFDNIKTVLADYQKANPNVTLDISKPDDVTNALKVAIPAGQGPDIIGWANDQIGTQALAGNIVALDDLGITAAFLSSTYEPAAQKGVMWKGKIWALPEVQEGIALVYNKKLVTDKYVPKDLDDLLAKAKQFQTDTGKFLVCNQGLGGKDAYHAAPVYFGFGMPSYVDDDGKVYLNTPEGLKAAKWLVEFAKVSPKETGYDICKAMLIDGKVGAWWTGPWAIPDIEAAKIDYGIATVGKPFVGIKSFMITKNAVDRGNQKAALDFIKWYTSADVQKKLALINKSIPAQTAALKDPDVQKLYTLAGFGAALNVGVPMAATPYSGAQWDPVADMTQAIWTGAQTPDAALADGQKAFEA